MKSSWTRREFLKRSSQGLIGTAVMPMMLSSKLYGAPENQGQKMNSISDYYHHFGVDPDVIRRVMEAALDKGGDYCDLYFQHKISNSVRLEDNQVNNASGNIDFGVGIRVLKGDQTGYSFTEEISEKTMIQAAGTAAAIAETSRKIAPVQLSAVKIPNYYPIQTPWETVSIDTKIPILQLLNDKAFELESRIIKSNIRFSNESSYILLATSEGRAAYDYQPMGQISISCTAESKSGRESSRFSLSGRRGIEFMNEANLDKLARKAVTQATDLLDAGRPPAGEMEVVLAAGSSGILLHEAIGHGMEADFNRKNVSIYSDLMNQKVGEQFVTIVDDGTNPNVRGSINIDDEGNESEQTVLVENGVLRSYLHDRISARHYGVKPTGSGRRQSFRHNPMPRMRNTYMLPGPHSREEIIRSVKKGIYADTFYNGEVWIGAGDFTFYVKSGTLIEDGRLTQPIKDINIIGNGPEVLRRVNMVGDDLKMAEGGWTCGKNGQSVPVSQGMPTVKVSSITVGGTES